jgi:prepilin-type processing-associated H-X9-DG protein
MLLPALNKARSKAMAAACISNQKQTIQVLQFYGSDNGSWYPATQGGKSYYPTSTNQSYLAWSTLLRANGYVTGQYFATGGMFSARFLACSAIKDYPTAARVIFQGGFVGSIYTYGLPQYTNDKSGTGIYIPTIAFKISSPEYSSPSTFAYVMDAANTGAAPAFPWYIWDSRDTQNQKPMGIHDGRCNVACLDGHVEPVSRGELYDKFKISNYTPSIY